MERAIIIIIVWALGSIAALSQAHSSISDTTLNTDNYSVEGKITDKSGEPIVGASVKLKNSREIFAITDVDGNFVLSNIPDKCTLQVLYVGYKPQDVKVSPEKKKYSVTLYDDNSILDEVVVVGYATQKKVDLTGAVSSVSADAL